MRASVGAARRALLALACALATVPSPVLRAQTGAVRGVHDPVIAKHGDVYWIFSTGRGIPIRRSRDLIHWDTAGRVFPDSLPAWAPAAVPGVAFPWAPDISFFDGRYHLYYSLSTFGGQRSAIGLATNVTLDPASPEYKWDDQGSVVESVPGVSSFNAIDPAVAVDERGRPWLAWGSFWGGIKMRRLDAATGKLSSEDTVTYSLAARAGVDATRGPLDSQSVEAPFIVRHGDYYYLFASYDLCCRGARSTYNVRVGRATAITGPYVDREGVALTEGGGTSVLAGSGSTRGPGHNSVLAEGDRHYLVHHFYDASAKGMSTLQIRPLLWGEDGWSRAGEPLAAPPPR